MGGDHIPPYAGFNRVKPQRHGERTINTRAVSNNDSCSNSRILGDALVTLLLLLQHSEWERPFKFSWLRYPPIEIHNYAIQGPGVHPIEKRNEDLSLDNKQAVEQV